MKRLVAQSRTFPRILTRLEAQNAERLFWVRGQAPDE